MVNEWRNEPLTKGEMVDALLYASGKLERTTSRIKSRTQSMTETPMAKQAVLGVTTALGWVEVFGNDVALHIAGKTDSR